MFSDQDRTGAGISAAGIIPIVHRSAPDPETLRGDTNRKVHATVESYMLALIIHSPRLSSRKESRIEKLPAKTILSGARLTVVFWRTCPRGVEACQEQTFYRLVYDTGESFIRKMGVLEQFTYTV